MTQLALAFALMGCVKQTTLVSYPILFVDVEGVEEAVVSLNGSGSDVTRTHTDSHLNQLLIEATPTGHAWVVSLIHMVDLSSDDQETPKANVYYLMYRSSMSLLPILRTAFPDIEMTLEADPYTNSIIAFGMPSSARELGHLISKLDIPKRDIEAELEAFLKEEQEGFQEISPLP